ncbi:hypothetical protein AT246_02280 [Bartonella henselae]|nr:hypothetical protein AT247_06210 [Bartonella henselae]OLL51345.1 hypothetical protein AT243_07245 [Bartonella henselae]OLL51627.1 hypothetical protein AT241_05200 [Bartonella henselae]OLL56645.1 hypothetical protein AT246_02280 [Bartonella henselae]
MKNYEGGEIGGEEIFSILLRDEKIIRLENGRLWSLKVEEELNNCSKTLEKVSKTSRSKRLSERAQKAAQARWEKHKNNACDNAKDPENPEHYAKNNAKVVKHDAYAMLNDANLNHIYNKKTNTIVLVKKEIGSEDSETDLPVQEPTKIHDLESQ